MGHIFRLVSNNCLYSHVLKRLFSYCVYTVRQAKQIKEDNVCSVQIKNKMSNRNKEIQVW